MSVNIRRGENNSMLLEFTDAGLEVANFDQCIMTIWQGGTVNPDVKITKNDGAAYSTYVLKVPLTQEETLSLTAGKETRLQAKMRLGPVIVESAIVPITVLDDLHGEVVSLGE